ncbi:hypothetical protein CPAR01_01681, partial [Colletotrichum paranaense]
GRVPLAAQLYCDCVSKRLRARERGKVPNLTCIPLALPSQPPQVHGRLQSYSTTLMGCLGLLGHLLVALPHPLASGRNSAKDHDLARWTPSRCLRVLMGDPLTQLLMLLFPLGKCFSIWSARFE